MTTPAPRRATGRSLSAARKLIYLLIADDAAGQTRRSALAAVAARVVNAGLVFLTHLLFARLLGPEGYGIVSTATTSVLLLGGLVTAGFVALPQRYLPQYAATGDSATARGLIRFVHLAPLALGLLVAAVAVTTGGLATLPVDPVLVTALVIGSLAVPANALVDTIEGVALANGWNDLAYGMTFVLRPLLVLGLFAGAVGLAAASPAAAMAAAALGAWIAAFALVAGIRRRLTTILPDGPRRLDLRDWFRTAWPVFLINAGYLFMTSVDVLALAALRPIGEVGVYAAAAKLVALVAFVQYGMTWATGHHFSALHQAGDAEGLALYAGRAARWTFWPSLAAALVVLLLSPLLLGLFGTAFLDGWPIVAVLLVGLVARSAVGPAEQLLVMTGRQTLAAALYGLTFVVNAAAIVVLVPAFGAIGAAAAASGSQALAALLLDRGVRARLGFGMHAFSAAAPR